MNRRDIEKLLGGYATGTLTPEEEQALLAAALDDQQLFDALAREQPLRELLRDPTARAALLASLDEKPAPWYRSLMQPRLLAVAGAAALLCLALPVAIWQMRHHQGRPATLVAKVAAPEPIQPKAALDTAPSPPPVKVSPPRAVRLPPALKKEPLAAEAQVEATKPDAFVIDGPPQKTELKAGNRPEAVELRKDANDLLQPAPAAPRFSATTGFLPVQGAAPLPEARPVQMRALAAAVSRLKWTVLSRQPGGEFAVADPAALKAGDTVELRLESQATGYVYIAEEQTLLASSPIEPGKPFDAVIEPRGAGQRRIECWFAARPTGSSTVGAVSAPGVGGGGGGPAGQIHPPSIYITLNYK